MPIRLSGMQSGLDTDTIVKALVSSYSLKKDNLVKAQTKLGWTQEKWKTTNSNVYKFYSGKLSNSRFSSNYAIKKASISNSSAAKVTAGSDAVNGSQTLKVKSLATTGYLTGGAIKKADGSKITGDTKLSDITGQKGGSMTVTTDGKTSTIELDENMTVDKYVSKLKSAGLNASFDSTNGRFFISSKTSGKDHDFSLVANDSDGLESMKKLGIYTANDTDLSEYVKWAEYSDSDIQKLKDDEFAKKEVKYENQAKTYVDAYNNAKKAIDAMVANDTWQTHEDGTKYTIDDLVAERDSAKALFDEQFSSYYVQKKDSEGNGVEDSEGNPVMEYDMEAIKEAGKEEDFNRLKTNLEKQDNVIDKYNSYAKVMEDNKSYVAVDPDSGLASADMDTDSEAYKKVNQIVTDKNDATRQSISDSIDSKRAMALSMVSKGADGKYHMNATSTADAVRITGTDSEIELNGAKFTSNTNNYAINGLTIEATSVTGDDAVTITTDTDIDGIYNKIKDFFKDYNELIKGLEESYNAGSSKGYEPLTDEEKEAMSDDEVEKWETKIKDSLLRRDSTLGGIIDTMKNDMLKSFTVNGKSMSLSTFGIKTAGYFGAAENEKGVFHIDGDSDDTTSSGNADKLRAMIASDPDSVINFFSQLSQKVYEDLGKKMSSSATSSAYTIYNDKEMGTQYSSYNKKISEATSKVTTQEDYYYKKFSAMESALAKLNSQTSQMSNMF